MRRQQDLQVNLRNRYRSLLTRDWTSYANQAAIIVTWMRGQAEIRTILDEIATAEADVDVDHWLGQCAYGRWVWPTTTEAGRARLIWQVMDKFDPKDPNSAVRLSLGFSHERSFNDALRDMTEQVIEPLFDYLDERIGGESSVLFHLERYKRRVEWFDQDALYEAYQANTQRGELVYDTDLRKFLFDQGMSMPFTQAKGASGLTDALGDLDEDDHLLVEVKLFDAASHGKRELGKGVNQVIQYAHDYAKSHGYLVIINLAGQPLDLPTDGLEKEWPPYVEASGVRVYLIQVRALPTASASKQPKAAPITVARGDLLHSDD